MPRFDYLVEAKFTAIETSIAGHKIVSRKEGIAARKELLTKEKETTRLRDKLAGERHSLPCVSVEKV